MTGKPKVEEKSDVPKEVSRRVFFQRMMQAGGLTAFCGLIWSAYIDEVKAAPLIIRPPGAIDGDDFLGACIKCGLCVVACANRPNRHAHKVTLKLAKPGDRQPMGTPYMEPRDVPCYMCKDVPCAEACPTGALDTDSLLDESGRPSIDRARMGVAVVDPQACVAYHQWGLQCDICYRACPLMDEAIYLKYERNVRTGKHAFLVPVIDADVCTGCGICEERCITEKASIKVLPREVVSGKPGDHYIRGWRDADQQLRQEGLRRKTEGDPTTHTPRSNQNPVDYLNQGFSEDFKDE